MQNAVVSDVPSTLLGSSDIEQNQNIVTYSGDDDESKNHDYSSCNDHHDDLNLTMEEDEESEILSETTKAIVYKDFSRIPPQPSSLRSNMFTSRLSSLKEPTFPVKLHTILSNPEFEDIIAWLPHGRSWRILQQKAFEERVIPLYFRHGRYSSFARQVNGWGFRRVTHGSDYNSYYQEMFLRGMPHLCDKMRRLTTKDVAERKKTNSNNEEVAPDFYQLSKENPVPEIRHASQVTSTNVANLAAHQHHQQVSEHMPTIEGFLHNPNRQRNTDLAILLGRSNLYSFETGANRGELLPNTLAALRNIESSLQLQRYHQLQTDSIVLGQSNPAAMRLYRSPLASTMSNTRTQQMIMRQQYLLNNPNLPHLLGISDLYDYLQHKF